MTKNRSTQAFSGWSEIGFAYELGGSLKSLTYPSGRVVNYTVDSAARLLTALDANGTQYVTNATYWPNGAEYQQWMPNIYFSTTLNNRLQVSGLYSDNGQVNNYYLNKTYTYAAGQNNGNIMSITNNKDTSRTQTFTYDALNRVTSGWSTADTGALSWGENYAVDPWGNLMTSPMLNKAHGGNFQCAGDPLNHATCLSYDAAGNVTVNSPASYIYDQENRISSTAAMTYVYDATGNRVEKTSSGTGTLYWYGAPGIIAESDLAGNLKSEYVFFGGKRVARIDSPGNTVHYYLSDHLNSTSMVVSSTGITEEESDYSAFGTEYPVTGSGVNHYKFTGKERDSESGLDYFGARYYSNGLGRFITPDWAAKPTQVPYAELADPQSLNLYSYVRNIPTTRYDADGHCGDHYKDGSCKVNVDPKTGKEGVQAAKQLEGVLNKYDKAVNALNDKAKFDIKDSKGKVIGSMSGKEIKAVWNGTSFTVTNKSFNNGGAGGGTSGSWKLFGGFSGKSELNPEAVSRYANNATGRKEAPLVGLSTLTFHELAHETHFGEALTKQYPVTPTISVPREQGTSSAGSRMSQAVGAPFDCSIPGGCQ